MFGHFELLRTNIFENLSFESGTQFILGQGIERGQIRLGVPCRLVHYQYYFCRYFSGYSTDKEVGLHISYRRSPRFSRISFSFSLLIRFAKQRKNFFSFYFRTFFPSSFYSVCARFSPEFLPAFFSFFPFFREARQESQKV